MVPLIFLQRTGRPVKITDQQQNRYQPTSDC